MSHIVQIQTEVRDLAAMQAACRRLQLAEPVHGETRLYSGAKTGWVVHLSGWQYPLVCDLATGQVDYDNFGGHWGEPQHLGRFLQAYALEKAILEARRQGHTAIEQPLADGSIKLCIQVGG